MTLNITQAHIDAALREQARGSLSYDVCSQCVVAQALEDALHHPIVVGLYGARTSGNVRRVFNFPRALIRYIFDFDARREVQPATFELEEVEDGTPHVRY